MRKLILLTFLLVSLISFSQEKRFEFETIDKRIPTGWNISKIPGEVVFYNDGKINTISIITEYINYLMYVKTRQNFVSSHNIIYTLVDKNYNESRIRIILENENWDYVIFYFYSDRPGEKYFRMCLKQCE